jgi:hypothetical protein
MTINFFLWTWTIPDDVVFWIVAGIVTLCVCGIAWLFAGCLPHDDELPRYHKPQRLPDHWSLR